MALNQPIEETISETIYHILKRTNKVNAGDKIAIGQEYREWIKSIENHELIPHNILFINTSTFGKEVK